MAAPSISAYLNTLALLPEAEKAHLTKFYHSMPGHLQKLVDEAADIQEVQSDTIEKSIRVIDHTSLSEDRYMHGKESPEAIQKLCADAVEAGVAAVCVYPNQIPVALAALENSNVKLAVVNNFPHGDQPAETALAEIIESRSADEIDTVIDYKDFLMGEADAAEDKLDEVATACKENGLDLKIILKASAYPTYTSLYNAAALAALCDTQFVKTCTGKMPTEGFGPGIADATTLLSAATVMQAVHDRALNNVGVKLSGGVKTAIDCERMRYLTDKILGEKYFGNPDLFRFGASSLLSNLRGRSAPKPGGY